METTVLLVLALVAIALAQSAPFACPIIPCGSTSETYTCTVTGATSSQSLEFILNSGGNVVQFNGAARQQSFIYPPEDDAGQTPGTPCTTSATFTQTSTTSITFGSFSFCDGVTVAPQVQQFDDDNNLDDDSDNLCALSQCPLVSANSSNVFSLSWDSVCSSFNITPIVGATYTFNYDTWNCVSSSQVLPVAEGGDEKIVVDDDAASPSASSCQLISCLAAEDSYECVAPNHPGAIFEFTFSYNLGAPVVDFDLQDPDLLATQSLCSTAGTWDYVDTNKISIGNFIGCTVDGNDINFLASAQSRCDIQSCPIQQYPPAFSSIYDLAWSLDCNSFVGTVDSSFQPNLYLSTAVYQPLVCRRVPKPVPPGPKVTPVPPPPPISFSVSASPSLVPLTSFIILAVLSLVFFAM